jgi:hypothetical protein
MKRIILGALAGGLVFFIWSAIIHMSPLGMVGLKSLPDGAYDSLKSSGLDSGLYFFPGFVKNPTPAQQKAWQEKLVAGPFGILVYTAAGSAAMAPKQLISEFVSDIVAAFLAACIIALIAAPYLKRVSVVALMGVFGWVSLLLSYWIWYNFPTAYILNEGVVEIVGWFLAGLAIAKIVPGRAAVTA